MLFISAASEADVVEAFAAGRNPAEGSGPWTMRFIRQATKQFDERWSLVEITGAEARAIVVPPHSGEPCRGDRMELVPPGGLSVESTAQALEVCREAYSASNRTCWSRIAQAIDDPLWSEIILTRAPSHWTTTRPWSRGLGFIIWMDFTGWWDGHWRAG